MIAEELREYVVTDHIEENLIEFLERYTATRSGRPGAETDKIGVWISGFFGSGKSHFAKILSHLLHNPEVEGKSAIDWFLERVGDSPRQSEIRGLLMQARNFFDNRTIMFQIKSEQDLINPDSISEIMYRKYLEHRGLSRTPWVGRLELELIEMGCYDGFTTAVESRSDWRWEKARRRYLTVQSDIEQALCDVLPHKFASREEAAKALENIQNSLEMGPALLAEELAEYVESEEQHAGQRSPHLVFIIDEMGQFIGDDGDKLIELQSIAESFGNYGRGKLWLIVTAQAVLEDVIKGVRRKRADYAKIIDRFDTRLEMTSENIEKVLEERILKKRSSAEPALQNIFGRHQGLINNVASLPDANRRVAVPNEERFVRDYPFMPFHFDLMQDAFANIRAKGGHAEQLTGGERSMLGVTQSVLISPRTEFAESDVGRLVRLDEIYDQIESEVPGSDRRSINGVSERIDAGEIEPTQVLKTLFILDYVNWIPRTLDNITRMLTDDVNVDFAAERDKVKDALDRLIEGRYVVLSDNHYKYLSAAERDIEEDIADEPVKNNDVRREARSLMQDLFSDVGKLNYKRGMNLFDIHIRGDEEDIRSKGDITLEIYSPIYDAFGNVNPDQIRDIVSPTREATVYWLPGDVTDLVPKFKRLIRMESVVRKREGKRDQSPEEVAVLREKRKEIDALRRNLSGAMSRSLYNGSIVYQGDETLLDGRTTSLNRIFNRELSDVIPHVYTKFRLAEVKVSEKSIEEMLTAPARDLPTIEPELDVWDDDQHVREHTQAVSEIIDELKRRPEFGQDTSGRVLEDHFSAVPYGWNPVVLRIVLAALFRAGHVAIKIGGKVYTDHDTKIAQDALRRTSDFRKATFEYDPERGLSLEERRKARRQIDILFDRKVEDTTNTLATTLQEELGHLQAQNERLRLQTGSVDLPVADILYKGETVVRRILENRHQSELVRQFLDACDTVDTLKRYQEQLERFVKEGRLETYRNATRLLRTIDHAQSTVPNLFGEQVQHHIDDMRVIEQRRQIVEKWGDYLHHYQAVRPAYQSRYADLYEQRTQTYRAVREQVTQFGEVPDIVTRYIVDDPDGWSDDGIHYAGDTAGLSDLYLQIQNAARVQEHAIANLVDDMDDGDDGDGEEKPAYVDVKSYLPKGFIADEATFDEALRKLKEDVHTFLKEGRKVWLE